MPFIKSDCKANTALAIMQAYLYFCLKIICPTGKYPAGHLRRPIFRSGSSGFSFPVRLPYP